MKTLVTYYSETGNTEKIAEAIFSKVSGAKDFLTFTVIDSLDGYDLIFFGFPIKQFGPPRKVRTFLKAHAAGKNIALFVTHASWEAPDQSELLAGWLERCKAAAEGANIVGFFHCRGELAATSAAQFLESEIAEVRKFGSLQPATVGHPDAAELARARRFALRVVKEQSNS